VGSNYKYNGTDLDSLFAPIGGASPGPDTGFKVGSQDLASRYYMSTGGDTIGYSVGYSAGGVDFGNMFRSIGYSGTGGGGGGGGGGGPGGGNPGGGGQEA